MNLLKMVTMLHIFEEISGNLAGLDVDQWVIVFTQT